MYRKLSPSKSTQQIKEERINFLLEDRKKSQKNTKKQSKSKINNCQEVLSPKSFKSVLQGNKKQKKIH